VENLRISIAMWICAPGFPNLGLSSCPCQPTTAMARFVVRKRTPTLGAWRLANTIDPNPGQLASPAPPKIFKLLLALYQLFSLVFDSGRSWCRLCRPRVAMGQIHETDRIEVCGVWRKRRVGESDIVFGSRFALMSSILCLEDGVTQIHCLVIGVHKPSQPAGS
jgi:hypothetical protein